RRVQPGRGPLPDAERRAAVPRHRADDPRPGAPRRAALAAEPQRPPAPRPGDDLPEMPAEGTGQALRERWGTGRRPAAVPGRQTAPCPAGGPGGAAVALGPA